MALSYLFLLAASVTGVTWSAPEVDLSELPNNEGGPLISIPRLAMNFSFQFDVKIDRSGFDNEDLMILSSTSYGDILRIETVLYHILVNNNDACWKSLEAPLSCLKPVKITFVDSWWSLYIDSVLQCEAALFNEPQQPKFTDVTLYAPPPELSRNSVTNAVISNVKIEDYWNPTKTPTKKPTTIKPTSHPTAVPTGNPTNQPSEYPTGNPTNQPTKSPTDPTKQPTKYPTLSPTMEPSEDPTLNPTVRGPEIRNASFTVNFISIEVRFDVDTNYGELPSNQDFDCSKLFTSDTAAMFDEPNPQIGSSASYCTWGKADQLLIYLGYNPKVDIWSELEFLPQTKSNKNTIRRNGNYGGYLITTAPTIVQYPSGWPDKVLLSRSVMINGPSQVGQGCSASFDAYTITGTAVRRISQYSWSITPYLVPSCIFNTSAARVEIPVGCLRLGNYTISVNVINWFGKSMWDKFQFEVLIADPPQVTVNGGNNLIIQAGERLEITLQVAPPSCLTADSLGGWSSAYSYRWYQSSEQESKKPYDELTFNSNTREFGNSSRLMIMSSDLIPGNFYEIKCEVDYQDNAGNSNKSLTSIGVSVFWDLPISLIEGTTQYLNISENYTASLEDNYIWPNGSGSEDYYFTVECDDCGDHLTLTNSSIVFTPVFEGEYEISLTAKHKNISDLSVSTLFTVSVNIAVNLSQFIFELRDSEATQITEITPGYRSELRVSALPENQAYYYNFSIMVNAEGFLEVEGSAFWDDYGIYADNEIGVLVFTRYKNSTQLKNEVKIRVMVAGDGDTIKLEKTYNINPAPTGGLCSTTPEEGTIDTNFEFLCVNWEDDTDGNIDVNFRYKRLDNMDGFSLEEFKDSYEDGIYKWNGFDGDCGGTWLKAWTTTRSITKTLPTAGVYLVCAYLRDSLGSTATVHNLVNVTEEVIFNATAIANLMMELKDAVNKTDYFKTAAIVDRIVSNTDSLANKQEGLEVRVDIIQTLLTIQVSSQEDVVQLFIILQGVIGLNVSEIDVNLARGALDVTDYILKLVDTYTPDDQPIPTEVVDGVIELLGTVAGAAEEIGEDLEDDAVRIITIIKAALILSLRGTIPGERYQYGDYNSDIFAQAQRVGDRLPDKCGGYYFKLPSNLMSTYLSNKPLCTSFKIPSPVIKGATYGKSRRRPPANMSRGLYSPVISQTFFSDQAHRRSLKNTTEIEIHVDAWLPIIITLPYNDNAGDVFDSVATATNTTQNYSFNYSAYFPDDSIEADGVKPIIAPLCQVYDLESNSWNSTGLELLENTGSEAICQSLHLTEFSVGLTDFIPEINVLTLYDFRQVNFKNMRKYPTVPLVLLGVLMLVPFGFCIVERENDKHLLAQPMLWSSYQVKIIEESYWGKAESIKNSRKLWCLKLIQRSWLEVKNKHMFYGLWMRDRATNLTGAQRVGVILLVLLLSLCKSAVFYGQYTMKITFDELLLIIYGAAFTSVIPVVLAELFMRHQPKMYRPTRRVKVKGRLTQRDMDDIQKLEGLTVGEISEFTGLQPSTLQSMKTYVDLRKRKSSGICPCLCSFIFGARREYFETPRSKSPTELSTTDEPTEGLGTKTKNEDEIMSPVRSRENMIKRGSSVIDMAASEPTTQTLPVTELSVGRRTVKESMTCVATTDPAGEREAKEVSQSSEAGEISESSLPVLPAKSCSRARIKSHHFSSRGDLKLRPSNCIDSNTITYQVDGNEITEVDSEILNELQEILLRRSFWLSKWGRLLTWIVILLIGVGCLFVTLTYGLQFDLKENCISKVLSSQTREKLTPFEDLVSHDVSLAHCNIHESDPLWDKSTYTSTINTPVSARWLMSFSMSFLLSTLIFTVFSLIFFANIKYCIKLCFKTKDVDEVLKTEKSKTKTEKSKTKKTSCCLCKWWSNKATTMIPMEILDQGVHDDSCVYELVLESECIPPEVTMEHLIKNPEILLQFARKKAMWKKLKGQDLDEERQLPLTPDLSCLSSTGDDFISSSESVVDPHETNGNNKERAKRQDGPRADKASSMAAGLTLL